MSTWWMGQIDLLRLYSERDEVTQDMHKITSVSQDQWWDSRATAATYKKQLRKGEVAK